MYNDPGRGDCLGLGLELSDLGNRFLGLEFCLVVLAGLKPQWLRTANTPTTNTFKLQSVPDQERKGRN